MIPLQNTQMKQFWWGRGGCFSQQLFKQAVNVCDYRPFLLKKRKASDLGQWWRSKKRDTSGDWDWKKLTVTNRPSLCERAGGTSLAWQWSSTLGALQARAEASGQHRGAPAHPRMLWGLRDLPLLTRQCPRPAASCLGSHTVCRLSGRGEKWSPSPRAFSRSGEVTTTYAMNDKTVTHSDTQKLSLQELLKWLNRQRWEIEQKVSWRVKSNRVHNRQGSKWQMHRRCVYHSGQQKGRFREPFAQRERKSVRRQGQSPSYYLQPYLGHKQKSKMWEEMYPFVMWQKITGKEADLHNLTFPSRFQNWASTQLIP